jgi:hypothetical protein
MGRFNSLEQTENPQDISSVPWFVGKSWKIMENPLFI